MNSKQFILITSSLGFLIGAISYSTICMSPHIVASSGKQIHAELTKKTQQAITHSRHTHLSDLILARTCDECRNIFNNLVETGIVYRMLGIPGILTVVLSTNSSNTLANKLNEFMHNTFSTCSICLDFPNRPILGFECDHPLCHDCFQQLIKKNRRNYGWNSYCPLCRNENLSDAGLYALKHKYAQ